MFILDYIEAAAAAVEEAVVCDDEFRSGNDYYVKKTAAFFFSHPNHVKMKCLPELPCAPAEGEPWCDGETLQ